MTQLNNHSSQSRPNVILILVDDMGFAEITQGDFYFTDAVTDKAIQMIEKTKQTRQPFCLYLAHAALHYRYE